MNKFFKMQCPHCGEHIVGELSSDQPQIRLPLPLPSSAAEIPGHLEDLVERAQAESGVAEELVRLVTAWSHRYGEAPQFCGTLRAIASSLNLENLLGAGDQSAEVAHMRLVLEMHAGQVISSWRLIAIAGPPIRFALEPAGPGAGPKPLNGDMEPTQ